MLPGDKEKILALYRKVSMKTGGIARSLEEVKPDYIQHCTDQAAGLKKG
jgi:hypothetical protein